MSFARYTLLVFALAAQACVKVGINRVAPASADATTIVVARHAEKAADDPRDPSLSESGRERARALAVLLKDADVAAVYGTQYKRTRETTDPIAQQRGLVFIERPMTAANTATYYAELAREVLAASAGKTVLIVGHSNTVPQIVQAFSGKAIAPMEDREYDHLFVIVVSPGKTPKLFNARFGRATP